MLSKTEFAELVTGAYSYLYDLVYLRTHPLVEMLVSDPSLRRKEKAWRLHHILLDVIEELDPGLQAPVFSREWRRHRLMVLHYVDGLDPQSVAGQLAISRRHYYRELKAAIEAIASILWDRYVAHPSTPQQMPQVVEEQASISRLELLRLEAARMGQANRYARVADVVGGVLPLLQEILHQRRLDVHLVRPEVLPGVSIDKGLLRQMLLGILGYLIEHAEQATIRLAVQSEKSAVCLSIRVEPPTAFRATGQAEVQKQLSVLEEMATLSEAHVLPVRTGQSIVGFDVQLPTSPQRTVLVVDDNEDVLELFRRYLSPHHYRVVTAQTAQDARNLASRLQPHAITLDLMMADQDGWDLLQVLLNQPDTRRIPIIVCSVLRQKELTLSLGATAFLEKPVTEQALLSALEALEET
jgi:CheY-like chemotaxis protein